MAKKGLNIRLDEGIIEDIEKVANAAGMDRNDYAALWLRKIAQLKLDYGLDALTSIPKDFFKSHGGRPSALRPSESVIDRADSSATPARLAAIR